MSPAPAARRRRIPVGREAVVDAALAGLAAGEPVVLCGPPGVGKSTIARCVAARRSAIWIDGAGAVDADAVLTRLAAVTDEPGEVVVILDDADGLEPDLERIAGALDARALPWLFTLRAHISPAGARPTAISPLPIDDSTPAGAPALFARALRDQTAGMPVELPPPDVARLLMHASDGLPAAVEALADAWWIHGEALIDGLRPLLGGDLARGAPVIGLPVERVRRHWSELDSLARAALVRLSAAPGAFDIAGAAAMVGEGAADRLRDLVRRGLVRVEGPGRFRLYRLVRAFAAHDAAQRGEHGAIDARYTSWLLATADGFAEGEKLPERPHPAVDLPTLYAALDRAWRDGDPAVAEQASTLMMYWVNDPIPPWDPVAHAATRLGDGPRARFFRAMDAHRSGARDRAFAEMKEVVARAQNPWVRVVALNWLGCHVAFEPSLRAQRAAQAFYEEATAACRALEVPWKEAHCVSCRAGLLQAEGQLAEALALYPPVLEIQATRPTWCHWAYNLNDRARLHAELGDFAAARADSDAAIEAHLRNEYPEYAAIAHADRGLVELAAGELEAAAHHLDRAMSLSATAPAERELIARTAARMAVVQALGGHLGRARRFMAEAHRVLEDDALQGRLPTMGWERPLVRRVLPLYRAFIAPETVAEAVATAGRAPAEGELALIRRSDEARLLLAMLSTRAAGGLKVSPDGARFRLDDAAPVDIGRFRAASAILARLARARVDAPGEGIDTDALFAAGWPGQAIDPLSAQNRVYAELSRLRKLGLKPYLERNAAGYRLDPRRAVAVGVVE